MCTQSVSWMSNRQRFKSKESRGLFIKFRMMKCEVCCRTLLDVCLFWVGTGCVNEAVLLLLHESECHKPHHFSSFMMERGEALNCSAV